MEKGIWEPQIPSKPQKRFSDIYGPFPFARVNVFSLPPPTPILQKYLRIWRFDAAPSRPNPKNHLRISGIAIIEKNIQKNIIRISRRR